MAKKQKKQKQESKEKSSFPTLQINREKDIAMDFATKCYEKFNKVVKSIILFGSQAKQTAETGSDIDIIVIVDDASISWDQVLMAWYREELGKIIHNNPYKKELHVNSVKLTTWWEDMIRGDPVVINIIRFGEPLVDFGGFFSPLKILLQRGKINSTPEAIYTALQRTPYHLARSKAAELGAIEGLYWAMVDSSHGALMAAKQTPPSPEHIPDMLREIFVNKGMLKQGYADMFKDLFALHKKIVHGEIRDLKGEEIDKWQERTSQFVKAMAEIVEKIT